MELDQLLAESDKELRQALSLLESFRPATEDVVVNDESGKVTVTFSPDNALQRIEVAPDWEKAIETNQLAAVISEQLGNAQAQVLGFDLEQLARFEDEATSEGITEADPAEVERERAALLREAENDLLKPRSAEEMQRRVDAIPGDLDALLARADEAVARLDKIAEDVPEDPAEHRSSDERGDVVASDNHMVSVRVVNGFVVEVTLKESWLSNRSGIAVTECFDQIIERLPEVRAAQAVTGD